MQACQGAGVSYFVDSGTLLGAVRHEGWIPWDDDVDVVMFREDYEALRRYVLAEEPLRSDISFTDWRSNPAHVTPTPRLLYLRSERGRLGRIRKWEPPEGRHIALDVFVLDHAPHNRLLRRGWLSSVRWLELMVMARATGLRGVFHSDESARLTKMVEVVAITLSRLLTSQQWRALHHSWCTVCRPSGSYVVTMYKNPRHRSLVFARDQFTPSRTGRFENRVVPLPRDWEGILSAMYGQAFMVPPPVEDQRPLHFRDHLSVELDDPQR